MNGLKQIVVGFHYCGEFPHGDSKDERNHWVCKALCQVA
jgi:hypothetical protein